jgi:CubicO group peptidase (beta-lactamase class C family)
MTLDNIFWIASCTKMIVAMACMQLVEKRLLSLDDSQQVEQLCPELKEVKVLQDDGTLVEKKRGITLRMLLSHTGESPAVQRCWANDDTTLTKGMARHQPGSDTRSSTRS